MWYKNRLIIYIIHYPSAAPPPSKIIVQSEVGLTVGVTVFVGVLVGVAVFDGVIVGVWVGVLDNVGV